MHAATAWFSGTDADTRRFTVFLLVSTAGHLILLILLVLVPHISPPEYNPAPIYVDLVMNAAIGPPPGDTLRPIQPEPRKEVPVKTPEVKEPVKPVKETVKETTKEPVVKPVKEIEPTVPTFKTKTSLKEKTYKSEKVIADAVSRMKEKVEKGQAESYQEALDRLARKTEGVRPGRFGVPGGTGGGGGSGAFGPLDIYKTELIFHIQKNWSYSEQLAGERKDLEALIGIKIMPNGEIREIWFDKRSGSQYLDESAEKAILKSSPLPPLPAGFQGPFLNQGLRFTPSGLQ